MNELRDLKRFLIIRFMQVVVATAVAESLLFSVFGRTVFRALLIFFFHTDNMASIRPTDVGLVILSLFFGFLTGLLELILPKGAIRPFHIIFDAAGRFTGGSFLHSSGGLAVSDLSLFMRLLFFLVFTISTLILLLPIVVAATYYSRVVMDKFRMIEEKEKAEQAAYEKKRNLMLSDIAHDLRTPMTTIAGYSKALEDDMISDERRKEIYAAIQAKSARMNDLIGLLFDYVKLDSDGFRLTKEKVDLCELVRESAALLYPDMEDAKMSPDIAIPDEQIMIEADKLQLSRVVTNLITNAIRHNAPGSGIGILVVRETGIIRVMICDKGDPIEPEMADHIFEPFVTGDESRNSRGGSGLGLSIAQKIVRMHGYSLTLVQQPDIRRFPDAASYTKMFLISIKTDQ